MRYIKIIRGTYGYKNTGSGITIPKTPNSPPFEVTDAEAERLVKLNVAKYEEIPAKVDVQEEKSETNQKPAYSEEMKLTDLQEIAKAYNVDASKMRTKKEVIAAIEAAIPKIDDKNGESSTDNNGNQIPPDNNSEQNNSGNDEQPPSLGTAAPEGATT